MDTDDPEIPNSLEIAHKRGIKVVLSIQKIVMPTSQYNKNYNKNDHKQSVLLEYLLVGATGTELNGFSVSLSMNTPTIIIAYWMCPWYDCSRVTDALSRYNINIAQMNVTRESYEKAIMIIEADSRSCEE